MTRAIGAVSVVGTLFYSLPWLMSDISAAFQLIESPHTNPMMESFYGPWEPRPFVLIPLLIGGLVSFSGNILFLSRVIKNHPKERLFILGILTTLIAVTNDIALGSTGATYLIPLSFIGFLFESIRFHDHLVASYQRYALSLTNEVTRLALLSKTGRIAQQMTHDIKTSLRRLFQLSASEKKEEAIEVYDSAMAIVQLYSARLSGEESKLEACSTEASKILSFVEGIHRNELRRRGIDFQVGGSTYEHLPLSHPEGVVIFSNLIQNSMEALASQNGEKWIRVQVTKQNTETLVNYSDSGDGIPTEIQEKIFQSTYTTKESGLGLGLSIIREILFDRRGLIRLRPELPNTSFELSFLNSRS